MPAAPSGRVYQVWLIHGKDKPRPTHTLFTVPTDGRARVEILESLKGTDQVLVTSRAARRQRAADEPSAHGRQADLNLALRARC